MKRRKLLAESVMLAMIHSSGMSCGVAQTKSQASAVVLKPVSEGNVEPEI
jgi:hypothetical protein